MNKPLHIFHYVGNFSHLNTFRSNNVLSDISLCDLMPNGTISNWSHHILGTSLASTEVETKMYFIYQIGFPFRFLLSGHFYFVSGFIKIF